MKNPLFSIFLLALVCSSFSFDFFGIEVDLEGKDLPTVKDVDLNKFSGHWYEIARLPREKEKEKDCICSQQTLELIKGDLIANNTCLKGSLFSEVSACPVKMVPLDNSNAKFSIPEEKLSYFIVELDEKEYKWALIGDPNRKALYIVSRKPTLSPARVYKLALKAKDLGFPVDKLIFPGQVCGDLSKSDRFLEDTDIPHTKNIDLNKFSGMWYEIARVAEKERRTICNQVKLEVQGGKVLANATFFSKDDLKKLEKCKSFMVPTDNSNTEFEVLDKKERLVVIDIADDYSWVLLGNPEKTNFWIKARKPSLDFKIIQRLISEVKKIGFKVDKVSFTPQFCGNNFDLEYFFEV